MCNVLKTYSGCRIKENMVRKRGLEPPYLAVLDPKSSASANFATSANKTAILSKECLKNPKTS